MRRRRVAIRRRMPRKFRRTGLRRHKSIGTQITIQYCTYLNLSSAEVFASGLYDGQLSHAEHHAEPHQLCSEFH